MTLNASWHHHFYPLERGGDLELRRWFERLAESQRLRDAVSFQIDTRYFSVMDLDLLNDFVGALLNCRQAEVEIQGPSNRRPVETLPITTSNDVLPSHIHSFSWISATLGIRNPIPLDNFPWRILLNDLPWAQLTHLSLDCPLSDLDALQVLSNGQAAFESVSLKLTENQDLLSYRVALRSLRSLKIDTHVPVRDFFSRLSLSALESLDLKSPVSTDEGSPILNEHLNVSWSKLRSLSLSNQDFRERHRCPVIAILMKCSHLQRFQWEGPPNAFEPWTGVLSFKMSGKLEELIVKSGRRGCKLLLEQLSYRGNVIKHVNISHLENLSGSYQMHASSPQWTHITVLEGITLSDVSEILNNGRALAKAAFCIIEGAAPLSSNIFSPSLQELEIHTNIRTPSLWEWLYITGIQSVKITFGWGEFGRSQVLEDMAPFLQRHPNIPSLLIHPVHRSSPYDFRSFDEN